MSNDRLTELQGLGDLSLNTLRDVLETSGDDRLRLDAAKYAAKLAGLESHGERMSEAAKHLGRMDIEALHSAYLAEQEQKALPDSTITVESVTEQILDEHEASEG